MNTPESIQNYLDSLPEDIYQIDVSNHGLTCLPDLTRFTHLRILNCAHNRLTVLPKLPDHLNQLYCSNNLLEKLPDVLPSQLMSLDVLHNRLTKIPPFPQKLINIDLSHNQIESIPQLPPSVLVLACIQNAITVIPPLPSKIIYVYCSRNRMESLPSFDNTPGLERFVYYNNPVYEIIRSTTSTDLGYISRVIGKVKTTFYTLKCRNKLRAFLYTRIREPQIKRKYHPSKLNELLNDLESDDEDAFHDALDHW